MNNIDGRVRVLGLIGNPIEHTFSPFIHNLLAEALKQNTIYVPFLVEKDKLGIALKGAASLNVLGLNVTVPYKTDVIPFVDVVDEKAERIGAVNTLKFINDKIYGYNTDADGLKTSCIKEGIQIKDKKVCILGAGGASKAVTIMCAEEKAQKIILVNRTLEKAYSLQAEIKKYYDIEIEVVSYEELKGQRQIEICFQTTSIGMYPKFEDCPINEQDFFTNLEYAVDIIYNPIETQFIKLAIKNGAKAINGLGMLFYQAVKAYEIWNEITIPDSILSTCYQIFYDKIYKK